MGRRKAELTDKLVVRVGCPEHEEGLDREEEVVVGGCRSLPSERHPLERACAPALAHRILSFVLSPCRVSETENGVCHLCRSL